MFSITINGESFEDLAANVGRMARSLQSTAINDADDAAREELQAKRSKGKAKPAPQPEPEPQPDSDEVDADLLAPAEPMPDTAKAVVDAGTGKPAAPADDAPIQMTFDDVKAAAAKLAAKDTPKLAAVLKKYKAGKLSDVPKEQLGDFASDVLEALEG